MNIIMALQRFHWIAILVMIILLLAMLIFIGLMMSGNIGSYNVYPPIPNSCPDYWMAGSDPGTCIIPTLGSQKNNIDKTKLNTMNTKGLIMDDNTGHTGPYSINFMDSGWGSTGKSAICAKRSWCNSFGILWDGVSNYNNC
jgi:hypothetical protein